MGPAEAQERLLSFLRGLAMAERLGQRQAWYCAFCGSGSQGSIPQSRRSNFVVCNTGMFASGGQGSIP